MPKSTSILFILLSTVFLAKGDLDCTQDLFIKATFHSKNGNTESVYFNYDYHFSCFKGKQMYFNILDLEFENNIKKLVPDSMIKFDRLDLNDCSLTENILAIHRNYTTHELEHLDYECSEDYLIPTAYKIHKFDYRDSLNKNEIHFYNSIVYAGPHYINLDTINLITLDSILWCYPLKEVYWLNNNKKQVIESQKAFDYFTIDGCDDMCSVIFFIYDETWNKESILREIEFESYNEDLHRTGGKNIFNSFKTDLQKAIQQNKVIYFVGGFP